MAEVKKNLVTKGMSGMLGKTLVFRQTDGKTYVSAAPNITNRVPTPEQTAHRERFQEAVFYARNAIQEPETKAAYQAVAYKRHARTAFAVAVADFFNAPDIKDFDLHDYTGAIGSCISVKITDDFKVKKVVIQIYPSDGPLVEEGDAVVSSDGMTWVYTATTVNGSVSGTRIVVKAYDLPGNLSEKEETLI
jgi:hypothetical protein